MVFIKVGDTVINTEHIAAIELDCVSITGKCGVVISLTTKGGLFSQNIRKFWFEGEAATRLQDYFSDPNCVTELLKSSSPRSQARERRRQWQHPADSLTLPEDFGEPRIPNDERLDPPEEPPSSSTIGRRPWGPQPPIHYQQIPFLTP